MPRRKATIQPERVFKRRTVWRATFLGEKGRPATVAEVDGRKYQKGKAVVITQAIKERLETLTNLQFEFQEV